MRFIIIFLLMTGTSCYAQWKNYVIGVKGDTLNRVDKLDRKQGPWVVKYDNLRGEPGYEEEGEYRDDKKEGAWRRYNLQGDLFAIENYRWGYKDGASQYFDITGSPTREESWRAMDPEKKYDTLDIEDVSNPGNYKKVIVKNEGASFKHGVWKFYDNSTGFITKTEFYILGQLQKDLADAGDKKQNDSSSTTTKPKAKPKEVLEFEKKNAGKKKIKVRDGSTGG
jgi:hypothetical protein